MEMGSDFYTFANDKDVHDSVSAGEFLFRYCLC
jgi:hypothetical protein